MVPGQNDVETLRKPGGGTPEQAFVTSQVGVRWVAPLCAATSAAGSAASAGGGCGSTAWAGTKGCQKRRAAENQEAARDVMRTFKVGSCQQIATNASVFVARSLPESG